MGAMTPEEIDLAAEIAKGVMAVLADLSEKGSKLNVNVLVLGLSQVTGSVYQMDVRQKTDLANGWAELAHKIWKRC